MSKGKWKGTAFNQQTMPRPYVWELFANIKVPFSTGEPYVTVRRVAKLKTGVWYKWKEGKWTPPKPQIYIAGVVVPVEGGGERWFAKVEADTASEAIILLSKVEL